MKYFIIISTSRNYSIQRKIMNKQKELLFLLLLLLNSRVFIIILDYYFNLCTHIAVLYSALTHSTIHNNISARLSLMYGYSKVCVVDLCCCGCCYCILRFHYYYYYFSSLFDVWISACAWLLLFLLISFNRSLIV